MPICREMRCTRISEPVHPGAVLSRRQRGAIRNGRCCRGGDEMQAEEKPAEGSRDFSYSCQPVQASISKRDAGLNGVARRRDEVGLSGCSKKSPAAEIGATVRRLCV